MNPAERLALINRYAAGPAALKAALAGAPEQMRKWRPAPDEFSVHEVVVHCADSETNAHGRIRYLVNEKSATIFGYEPMEWAQTFDYHAHPLDAALLTIEAVRANTVPLLRRLDEEQWASRGTHTESGVYTAGEWLRIYAAHCHEHAEQIEAVVAAWRAAGEP